MNARVSLSRFMMHVLNFSATEVLQYRLNKIHGINFKVLIKLRGYILNYNFS